MSSTFPVTQPVIPEEYKFEFDVKDSHLVASNGRDYTRECAIDEDCVDVSPLAPKPMKKRSDPPKLYLINPLSIICPNAKYSSSLDIQAQRSMKAR